ncbi:hypothetical protein [Roseisolibacter agri]|nr:hypothetical protein [Roseisolibacter agri]
MHDASSAEEYSPGPSREATRDALFFRLAYAARCQDVAVCRRLHQTDEFELPRRPVPRAD